MTDYISQNGGDERAVFMKRARELNMSDTDIANYLSMIQKLVQ